MKTYEITVTLRVRSDASEQEVRKLLESTLCDTKNAHSYDAAQDGEWVTREAECHIVGVDAGHDPCRLSQRPHVFMGERYAHIIPWRRRVAA